MPLMTWNARYSQWDMGLFGRPAQPVAFRRELLGRFMETRYCRTTFLRQFLEHHDNVWEHGVINALHRRHIVSWDFMKRMLVMLANTRAPNPTTFVNVPTADDAIEALLYILNPNAPRLTHQAQALANNPAKATAFERVANLICWSANNVWIGEAQGNQGTDIDLGDDDIRELLNGTPFRGIATHYFAVSGWLEARNEMELV